MGAVRTDKIASHQYVIVYFAIGFLCLIHSPSAFCAKALTTMPTKVYPFSSIASHLVKCTLSKGTSVEILDEDDGWYKVKGHFEGRDCVGWIERHCVAREVDVREPPEKQDFPEYAITKNWPTYIRNKFRSDGFGSYYDSSQVLYISQNPTPIKIIETKAFDSKFWHHIEVYIEGKKHVGWIRNVDVEFEDGVETSFNRKKQEYETLQRDLQKAADEAEKRRQERLKRQKQQAEKLRELQKYTEKLRDLQKEAEKAWEEKEKLERLKRQKQQTEKAREMASKGYMLELTSWHWISRHGYAVAEGQVKNITNLRLKNVIALVSWYNENGDFITSDSSHIEYTTLMPGQVSPFKVMADYNPQMKKATIDFKFLVGGPLRFYER